MKAKKVIAVLFVAALATGVNAQDLGKAYETSENFEKTNSPAVAIKVRGDQKLVMETLQNVLKKDKLKGKVSGNILKFEKISFPNISDDYLNLYCKVSEIGKQDSDPQTIVYAFVSKGANNVFVAGNDGQLIENLKQYLEKNFYPQMQLNFVNSKTQEIKNTENSISLLEKKIKDREKAIKNAENNISKIKKEIEDNKKELQNQQNILNQQKENLKKMK